LVSGGWVSLTSDDLPGLPLQSNDVGNVRDGVGVVGEPQELMEDLELFVRELDH
jgi:hypothetical protein